MVIDLFPFFNELDILKMRLEIMDPIVDRFVIEESRYTFSGEPKELCFEANKEMFAKWLPKIEYIVVNERKDGATTHERDVFQKNHLINGLKNSDGTFNITDKDILIVGDVDEIPNPEVITQIIKDFDSTKVYHLAQRMFYAFLNLEEVSGSLLSITGEFENVSPHRKWLGTKVLSLNNIPESGIIKVREIKPEDSRSLRIEDGGWHFGYMGSHHETDVAKRISTKVVAAAHQEYNTEDILKEARDRLILGQDMFGRDAKFIRVDIDETYPEYLRNNIKEYDYLILPKAGEVKKTLIKIKLKVFRPARRIRRKIKRMLKQES